MEKIIGMFLEGLLSFFSPCVLPLVPLYTAYLSSGTVVKDGEKTTYNQKKTFILTLCFIVGICSTFALLALSITSLNRYISNYKNIIGIIGGILLIIFGLNQSGILKIKFLNREIRFDYRLGNNKINYLEAFMLGFVFSFAWTPCIGPMLSNAILLSTQDSFGSMYIVIYALGLVIPFLITGLFTTSVLKFINSNKKLVKYTGIISGIIVICFGVYMIFNAVNDRNSTISDAKESLLIPNKQYSLISGEKVSLYDDHNVAVHYSASWCHYCIEDLPYFEEFCNSHEDLTCYLVMNDGFNRQQGGVSTSEFYKEYRPSIDLIIDNDYVLFDYFKINSVPITYFTDGKGNILKIIPGAVYDRYDSIYSEIK